MSGAPFCIQEEGFAGSGIFHGFFGRKGGVSTGLYDSLNCGLGTQDERDAVMENRRRVLAGLPGTARLLTLWQQHTPDCLDVEMPWTEGDRPVADAMVTDRPGLALGILTADCAPVLFYGQKPSGQPVIGAAHAGWKGALGGVLESTVRAMVNKGADMGTISAVIGPCIGPESYEVGPEFLNKFLEENYLNSSFFRNNRFDLPAFTAARLRACGISQASFTGQDTYMAGQDFFSFRRTTHRREPDYGRQLSVIAVNG